MFDYIVLTCAAFLAGILNTLAGGGTFLTFPALVYAGIPPVAANATSAVAVFPGYLGGAAGFRRELKSIARQTLLKVMALTVLGGLVGSLLLLMSSNDVFSAIVPFLLLAATLVSHSVAEFRHWLKETVLASNPLGRSALSWSPYTAATSMVVWVLFSLLYLRCGE